LRFLYKWKLGLKSKIPKEFEFKFEFQLEAGFTVAITAELL
jgi:hypothetical protein